MKGPCIRTHRSVAECKSPAQVTRYPVLVHPHAALLDTPMALALVPWCVSSDILSGKQGLSTDGMQTQCLKVSYILCSWIFQFRSCRVLMRQTVFSMLCGCFCLFCFCPLVFHHPPVCSYRRRLYIYHICSPRRVHHRPQSGFPFDVRVLQHSCKARAHATPKLTKDSRRAEKKKKPKQTKTKPFAPEPPDYFILHMQMFPFNFIPPCNRGASAIFIPPCNSYFYCFIARGTRTK